MSDEYDELIEGAPEGIAYVDETGKPEEGTEPTLPPDTPPLVSASDLLDEEETDLEELGFEPDEMYRGCKVIFPNASHDPRHDYLFEGETVRAFYVKSKDGTIGLVPWPGSTVVWPWEQGWEQDLYHDKQSGPKKAIIDAFLAAQKKKAKDG